MQTIGSPIPAPTQDAFTPELTLEQDTADTLSFVVANNSAIVQLRPLARRGGAENPYGPELLINPQTSPPIKNVSGARFRSATAGQPALVIAQLVGPDDPQISGGTPFTQALTASGGVGATVGIYDRNQSSIIITNDATEQTIYSKTIRAVDVVAATMFRFGGGGDFLHNAGAADNVRLRLSLGATLIIDTGAGGNSWLNTTGLGAQRQPWQLEGMLEFLSLAQQRTRFAIHHSGAATPAPPVGEGGFNAGLFGGAWKSAITGVDFTADQIFKLTAQWSAANVNNTLLKESFWLELL